MKKMILAAALVLAVSSCRTRNSGPVDATGTPTKSISFYEGGKLVRAELDNSGRAVASQGQAYDADSDVLVALAAGVKSSDFTYVSAVFSSSQDIQDQIAAAEKNYADLEANAKKALDAGMQQDYLKFFTAAGKAGAELIELRSAPQKKPAGTRDSIVAKVLSSGPNHWVAPYGAIREFGGSVRGSTAPVVSSLPAVPERGDDGTIPVSAMLGYRLSDLPTNTTGTVVLPDPVDPLPEPVYPPATNTVDDVDDFPVAPK